MWPLFKCYTSPSEDVHRWLNDTYREGKTTSNLCFHSLTCSKKRGALFFRCFLVPLITLANSAGKLVDAALDELYKPPAV